MSAPLYFLPWLRRGLGLELGERDTGQATLPRGAAVSPYVEIDGDRAYGTLSLRPPDHATGIDLAQIIRRYPQPNAVDAEYGYFPLIELSAPDLPWVLTPVVEDQATGRMRPWAVLVCVEDESAELVSATADRPARLLVPADQLPDLSESYAWVHVQSIVPAGDVVESLNAPGSVVARLVCPRRLEPEIHYRAALVLAFAADGDLLKPAWDAATPAPALTVYDTWTFTTGEAGSFEELCRRLGPVSDESLELGLHAMDATELGSVDPWPTGTQRVVVDYTGALCDAEISPRALGTLKDEFDTAVTDLLGQGSQRVELALTDPDPVVTPPFFGSFAADTNEIPDAGWLRQLNLAPNRRAAAGLGAEIVRIHQERFMVAAWRQAGAIRETNRELSVTRLQAEIGRTWRHRANRLDDLQRVAVLRGQLTFVRDEHNEPPRRALQESTIPDALTSPAYLRVTRPGAVVATAVAARGRGESDWTASVATSVRRRRRAAGDGLRQRRRPARDGARRQAAVRRRRPPTTSTSPSSPGSPPPGFGRSPRRAARLMARIPALADLRPTATTPTSRHACAGAPVIDEALVWSLVDLSPELLLPGVGDVPAATPSASSRPTRRSWRRSSPARTTR